MKGNKLKGILLFISLILVSDFLCGIILKNNFSKISFGVNGEINKILSTDSEILILGSSRARHHFDARIFADSLGLSCFNSGLGGQGLFYNYAVLKERIKLKSPRLVILDISPNVIIDKESYSKLNIFLPYYKDSEAFKEIIELDPDFSRVELFSNLYIYNSTIYDFLRSGMKTPQKSINGYEALEGEIDGAKFEPYYLHEELVDKNKIIYLKKIINACKKNNIRLIGVISPTYQKFDQQNIIINQVKELFVKEGQLFLDYSNFQELYQNPNFFKDQLHLNLKGTDIFSKALASDLKANYKTK